VRTTAYFVLSALASAVIVFGIAGEAFAHVGFCSGKLDCVGPVVDGNGNTTCQFVRPSPGGNQGCRAYGACTSNCIRPAVGPSTCPYGGTTCSCTTGLPDHAGGTISGGDCEFCYNINHLGQATVYYCTSPVCIGSPAIDCEIAWTGNIGQHANGMPTWEMDCWCH